MKSLDYMTILFVRLEEKMSSMFQQKVRLLQSRHRNRMTDRIILTVELIRASDVLHRKDFSSNTEEASRTQAAHWVIFDLPSFHGVAPDVALAWYYQVLEAPVVTVD